MKLRSLAGPFAAAVAASAMLVLIGGLIGFAIGGMPPGPPGAAAGDLSPVAAADPPVDARFVELGRSYLPGLGRALAAAYEDGARVLDAGGDVEASTGKIAETWAAGRLKVYTDFVIPELAKIVPEGAAPADVTPARRAALAAAYRGFARGVGP